MKVTKHILGIVVLGAMTLTQTGCQSDADFLEEHSYKFDDQGMFNSENEIEMAINSCYNKVNYLVLGQTHGYHSYMLTGVGLDTYCENNSNDCWSNWTKLNSANGYSRHWYNETYYLVNYANTAIDAIMNKDIKYTTATKKNELLGEARFFRGWAYRILAGMFGNVPILETATKTIEMGYQPNTRQEVWEFCYEDFKFAAENMATTERAQGCVTRAAADHMLAEICLALGKFDEAIAAASRVINKQDGDYQIMTTRFGLEAGQATDRYGHSLAADKGGAYWDLFRVPGTGSGNTNQDYGVTGNKEAIWTSQFSVGNYAVGGSGDAWWRMRNNTMEGDFMSNKVRAATNTRKLGNATIYLWGDDAACYPEGIQGGSSTKGASETASNRYVANNTRDSIGGGYAYGSCRNYPCRYVFDPQEPGYIWAKATDPAQPGREDIRGSETMMQRNWYTPSGKPWPEIYKAAKAREAAAKGTANEDVYKLSGGDTIDIFPRFWKFAQAKHPNGDAKECEYEPYMIRVAETYLLRAEAYLAKGDTQKAADDINVVRARANAPLCSASEVDIDYILDERTRELFGEEHRCITLNRLSCNPNCGTYVTSKYPTQNENQSNTLYERVRKYGVSFVNETESSNADKGRVKVEYTKNDGTKGIRFVPNIQPYNYQQPIPDDVIKSNSGAEYPQNYGY